MRGIMDITKYPQFQLYLLTRCMLELKDQLISKGCDEWPVNATIINRAYYSSFLYCELWLEYFKHFKIKCLWEFGMEEEHLGEHKQVREALYNCGEKNMEAELLKLFFLRKKLIMNHSSI